MTTVAWVLNAPLDPEQSYFAVATDGLKISIWNLSGFLTLNRHTQANIKQMEAQSAVLAYALDTQFNGLMTNSRTLSIWTDMASIREYTYQGAHSESMTELAKIKTLDIKHAMWRFSGADGLPTWDDAYQHIYRPTKTKPAHSVQG